MFVVTIDQVDSTHGSDRVPDLLDQLDGVEARLPFVRTVGDEIQGVIAQAPAVIQVAETVARAGRWSLGVGVGDVDEPLADSAPASRGPAFVAARDAVEDAKTAWARVSVRAANTERDGTCEDAQTVLRLLTKLVADATEKQWAVMTAQLAAPSATQKELASQLGVTQQMVSQVLRGGGGYAVAEARVTAARLLTRLDVGE